MGVINFPVKHLFILEIPLAKDRREISCIYIYAQHLGFFFKCCFVCFSIHVLFLFVCLIVFSVFPRHIRFVRCVVKNTLRPFTPKNLPPSRSRTFGFLIWKEMPRLFSGLFFPYIHVYIKFQEFKKKEIHSINHINRMVCFSYLIRIGTG